MEYKYRSVKQQNGNAARFCFHSDIEKGKRKEWEIMSWGYLDKVKEKQEYSRYSKNKPNTKNSKNKN